MSREQFCLDTGSWSRPFALVFFVLVVLIAAIRLPAEASWTAVGPAGGDARSFATVPGHPNHLYLGTTTSWVYESNDGGASWQHLARLDGSDNLVIDNIVVDSANSSRL